MRRRTYLGVLAGGLGLAGCMGADEGGEATPTSTAEPTPTPTPEPTPTRTETPTPTPEAPTIEQANLVWGSGVPNFVENHAIDGTGAGGYIKVGILARLPVHAGLIKAQYTVSVLDESGTRVAGATHDLSFEASGRTYSREDVWVGADVSELDPGTYTADVTALDTQYQATNDPYRFDFDLREPLGAGDVGLVDYRPDSWPAGEPVRWTLELENRTGRANAIVGDIIQSPKARNYSAELGSITFHLPAEDIVAKETWEATFDSTGRWEFWFDYMDLEWETEFT